MEKISSMRGSIIDASTWREISRSERPPTPGTDTMSPDETSDARAQPAPILICSALSIGVRNPMAMSLVTLAPPHGTIRSEEHTSELQSLRHLVCRLLLEKKKKVK